MNDADIERASRDWALARERLQAAIRYKQESVENNWTQHIAWSTDQLNQAIEDEAKAMRILMQLRGQATL